MTRPPVDKQNRGQILYRLGKYREALEVFTSIIEKWHDPPVSVLDNRAATFLKLNDFPKALKDARSIMRSEKTQVSGYLRAGQILQKWGQSDKARNIYVLGLKHVGPEDSKLLREMIEDLRQKSSSSKAMDILMSLPLELCQMILSYLTFRELV
ncbi:MAG: hypothetical protein LQ340_001058 [Diploschistes diacapsis]|nr:MAG: hypothetical protein LQ340_001058 [Diploschistes diacapsis]